VSSGVEPIILDQIELDSQSALWQERWAAAAIDVTMRLFEAQKKEQFAIRKDPLASLEMDGQQLEGNIFSFPLVGSLPGPTPVGCDGTTQPIGSHTDTQSLSLLGTRTQGTGSTSSASSDNNSATDKTLEEEPRVFARCPVCDSDRTESQLVFLGFCNVSKSDTWGRKDAPTQRYKIHCLECGIRSVQDD
jgi:hypothetical protein